MPSARFVSIVLVLFFAAAVGCTESRAPDEDSADADREMRRSQAEFSDPPEPRDSSTSAEAGQTADESAEDERTFEFASTGATVIVFDEDDNLVDFVHVPADSDITGIEFQAPETGEQIFAAAVGPNRHEILTEYAMTIGTRTEGNRTGAITVRIADGIIQGLDGHSIHQDLDIPQSVLAEVDAKISDASHENLPSTQITRGD